MQLISIRREARLQYTIEARELTSESTERPRGEEPARTIVEASDPGEAVREFARNSRSEVVSLTRPQAGRESIATMRKDDAVYLVRIYED
jgi:hypothetical protein